MSTFVPDRDEWRDALDQRWATLLADCELTPLMLPNHPAAAAALLKAFSPLGAILTGGGDCRAISGRSDPRDETERVVLDWATCGNRPILGVCRGMQVLLADSGASLDVVNSHVGSRHRIRSLESARWVNSYHAYAARTAPAYQVMARSEDGIVEWIRRAAPRQEGIMWHPEREAPAAQADIEMIKALFFGH
ncbi:gamma-glutamyl-gamma-aminobutyrate hydrolase family protein [Burkholderia ubonensis]|uniref:gamma-glutamyl-gamma-aminobutyrate hydrolase family protein n=1 Tax=Burkholderia ubonensis TaxID=101571 RepID=UPI0018DF150E|nr:gamma-glutamyl-gamma-aminobutyrate hydrolase family protein [Burkholderia ubonensis]